MKIFMECRGFAAYIEVSFVEHARNVAVCPLCDLFKCMLLGNKEEREERGTNCRSKVWGPVTAASYVKNTDARPFVLEELPKALQRSHGYTIFC
jgi:hypothetical protein